MSERVTMPALGESVTEGTVSRWLKNVGDAVAVDEPLLEVSTDKVDTEIPSPVAGVLQEILVAEDETVAVGTDLAVIGDATSVPVAPSAPAEQPAAYQAPTPPPATIAPSPPIAARAQEEAPRSFAAPATPAPVAEASVSPAASPAAEIAGGTTVRMPALGESVTEGTVSRWLKNVGDAVAVDEPLLEVSTDKVDTEIPSPVAGTVTKILVGEDETVAVGADLAIIGGQVGEAPRVAAPVQEPAPAAPVYAPAPAAPVQEPAPAASMPAAAPAYAAPPAEHPAESAFASPAAAPITTVTAPAPPSVPADASAYVTPLVRKLASDSSVDLAALKGTGVGGRIRKQDVLDAASAALAAVTAGGAPASAPAPNAVTTGGGTAVSPKRGTTEKMSRLRKVIAARMVESLQVSAQLTTVVEVDVTKVARLRDKAKREFETREGAKLSFLPFFALAAVEALKAHPTVNSSVEGDQITYHGSENLGVAVDTERGLLVPVIKDAGDLNIAGLARKIADLAERTRTNKVSPDELAGGTFTLTNTGSRGALFDTPIINQPNVAILGTGAVVKRPVVVKDNDGGETIAIRSIVYLALSYDHRVVDGADAARFLMSMKARLEEGAFEASLGL
jgi:pyruvate dehydrogenase E2 component (dihydrolipoamide acetyltransferase)